MLFSSTIKVALRQTPSSSSIIPNSEDKPSPQSATRGCEMFLIIPLTSFQAALQNSLSPLKPMTSTESLDIISIAAISVGQINVKSFRIPHFFNSIVYAFFRSSKANRSYNYAIKLIDLGVNTPSPICYCEVKNNFLLKTSFYISEQIDFDFQISEVINNRNFPNRINILNAFVRFTLNLHENGINFLDHSQGNTLVKLDNNKPIFYLVDLNRMRFEKMNFKMRIMNFRRLTNDKEVINIISSEYAKLSNRSKEEVFKLMMYYTNQFLSRRSIRKKIKKFFS